MLFYFGLRATVPSPLSVPATSGRRRLCSVMDGSDREPASGPLPSWDALSDALSDASWDLFVMPGEHANSRYDRPLQPLEASGLLEEEEARPYDWDGQTEDEEALRLPKGRAAERLAAPASKPRGLWFERRGRDIAGDIEVLSREWTRLWVISVAVSLCILAADSQANLDAAGPPGDASGGTRQEQFIRRRVEERLTAEVLRADEQARGGGAVR
mmetsp:Transcript_37536/g.118082  ORF Transcript_37536/g.118082 Transcript_37536/m.118082 type:complete len:214 (+) Transcript_37536:66-707(+)